MKTIFFVLAWFCAACAFAQAPAQAQNQSVYTIGIPQHRISIQNTAPWNCQLVTVAPAGKLGLGAQVLGLADMFPGKTVFAGRKKGIGGFLARTLPEYALSSDLSIPLVALYYTGVNQYIGAASGTLWIPGNGISSVSQLTFAKENIRFADDVPTSAPTVAPHLTENGIVIPYFATDGTSTQVFVWNSSTPAHITMDGTNGEELRLGNVKAYVTRSPIVVTISAVDETGKIRTWTQGFQNSNYYGTWAQIFILGMRDLR
jgi:hypothetical protein